MTHPFPLTSAKWQLSGGVVVLQRRCETLWELAGLATTGTHGGYNDSPE